MFTEATQIQFGIATVLAPIASFVLIAALAMRRPMLAKIISLSGGLVSLVLASLLLFGVGEPGYKIQATWDWLLKEPAGFSIGILLDPLSLVMLWVVAVVGFLVQWYSVSYMEEDANQSKFFAFISLFCFAMMGFTIAPNLLQSFMCWELVGLGSYLLIGFWNHLPSAATAARKAFVVTRLGDLGFFAALLLAATGLGALDFGSLADSNMASGWKMGLAGYDYGVWISLALFLAVIGKSAQFPLYGWLPDAMEGPTPVSALIHAATMVAAGVYLLARTSFIVVLGSESVQTVWHGLAMLAMLTALMSGMVAIVQSDIKRVFAYSTISQLGYMVVGIGSGAVVAGMMHLFTHAFFKALLFLTAGAFIHAAHSNSITEIARAGGAKLKLPMIALGAGSLALMGIFPFAGFYSKDAILEHLFVEGDWVLYVAAMFGVLVTSYYTARVIFLMLKVPADDHLGHHLHVGGWMKLPLAVLTVGALVAGNLWMWKVEHWFHVPHGEHGNAVLITTIVSTLCALAGLYYSARVFYWKKSEDPMANWVGLANVLREKWYLDTAYDKLVHNIYLPFTAFLNRIELRFVKGALDGIGTGSMAIARTLARVMTGEVQQYVGVSFAVVAAVVIILMNR
ncbi:MAG: NADH-quinone oxidoreductase subunit L [Calditrichaeota bacterium]|nr:NADH-quinone oxidoreductase subunit L [Calditrichota bacterium]